MKTQSKSVDLLVSGILELLFCGGGLLLLVVTLPQCASGEYHWYHWFGLICGLRLVTYRHSHSSTAPKAEETQDEDEPIES